MWRARLRPNNTEEFPPARAPVDDLRAQAEALFAGDCAASSPRASPTGCFGRRQLDDRAIFQASPDELPVIDIYLL